MHNRFQCKHLLRMAVGALLLTTGTIHAQGVFGAISGEVTDTTGAAIPNASVSVTNTATGVVVKLKTNGAGIYSASSLIPGPYRVEASTPGFKKGLIDNITLNVGGNPRESFQLQVGASSDVVEVTSQSPLLETQQSMLSQTITAEQFDNLPINGSSSGAGQDPWSLISLSAGVTQQKGVGGYAEDNARINGGRPRQDDYLLDGTSISQPTFGGPAITPSPDTVAEMQVVTNNFSAEYGRVSGGIISILTKSGTNKYHGSAYEFAQNSALDAKNYFQAPNTANLPFSYNEYGGTLGGAIRKNKLFYFVDYQGVRSSTQTPVTNLIVPNAAFRKGDLSAVSAPIINPATKVPYAGNQVPVSAIAAKLLDLYPVGNAGAAPGSVGSDYFNGTSQTLLRAARTNPRVDYDINSSNHLFGAFHYQGQTNTYASPFPTADSFTLTPNKAVTLGYTHIFSSTLVNDLRYGFDRRNPLRTTNGYGVSSPSDYGIVGLPACNLPQSNGKCGPPSISIGGYTSVGGGSSMLVEPASQNQVTDILTKTFGKNTLKLGGQYDKIAINNIQPNNLTGSFNFGYGVGTNNPFANFLVGYLSQSSVQVQSQYLHSTTSSAAVFAQDDYRLTPKLTLNIGVRWQYDPSWTEKNNQLVTFNPYTLAFQTNGTNGYARGSIETHWKEFAPRLGFAFSPVPNTVVRGGYGITFPGVLGHGRAGDGNPSPNILRTTNISAGTSLSALPTIQSPVANAPYTLDEAEYNVFTPYHQAPEYVQQYNLTVNQQLSPALVMGISYVGSHGVHLPTSYSYNLCQTSAAAITQSGAAASTQDGPYCAPGSYNALGGLYGDYVSTGYWGLSSSSYNALQAKLEKRPSANGLSFTTSFTWSKLIDDSSSDYAFGGLDVVGQDFYHRRSERSISSGDVPITLSFAPSYELPFGPGKKFATTGLIGKVLGGFRTNAIYTFTSGLPVGIYDGGYRYGNAARLIGTRPTLIGSPTLAHPTLAKYFNTAAFDWSGTYVSSSAALQPHGAANPAYAFGNWPRFGSVRSPRYNNLDLSLQRNFHVPLGEAARVRVQADAFDALNHPIFSAPDGTPDSTYGQITSTRGGPRVFQFSAHLTF